MNDRGRQSCVPEHLALCFQISRPVKHRVLQFLCRYTNSCIAIATGL